MNLWAERAKAIGALQGDLAHEGSLIDRGFQQLEYVAQALPELAEGDPLGRIAGLVTAKGRALAQATWSLMLDSLGQEAGATGRVWLEAIELLIYLRQDPSRALEVVENRLPTPGVRAKKIEGFAQPLREMWNSSAAHIGTDPFSWMHMINWRTGQVKTRFAFSSPVLRRNMGMLFAMLTWNIREAALCLNEAQGYISESLAEQIDSLKDEGFSIFHGPAPGSVAENEATT